MSRISPLPPHPQAAPSASIGEEWFPLAPNQKVIWFHELLNRESPSYNIGGYLEFRVPIDKARMAQAYQLLLQRHDALRTEIRLGPDGEPRQRFNESVQPNLQVFDLQHDANPEQAARHWMQRAMDNRFHFDRPPYAEAAFLILSRERSFFFLNCHHVITDGWSFSLLGQELCRLYDCLSAGLDCGPLPPSYRPYVEEEHAYQTSVSHERDVEFWRRKFPSVPRPTLPVRGTVAPGETISGKSILSLPRDFYDRLEDLVADAKVTAFHVLLTAIHSALAGYHGQPRLVIGTPLLNRTGPQRRRTVGLFAGILPVIVEPKPEATIREAVEQLAADMREAYRHRRFPLTDINRSAGLVSSGRAQLFDVTLSFERHDYEMTIAGHRVTTVPLTNTVTPLPLGIFVREFTRHEDVQIEFIHRTDCLSPQEVEWLKQRFRAHLELFLANPDGRFADLPLLCEEERTCLAEGNNTTRDLIQGCTALDLFAHWVAATPEHAAVVDGEGKVWSYRELDARANQTAAALEGLRLAPEMIVGVCLERGADQVASVLGVMKAGCVYLPLGLNEADERLAGILADAEVRVVIASPATRERAAFAGLKLLCPAELPENGTHFTPAKISLSAPAYCMFTSGSTGKPKGVRIAHAGLANYALAMAEWSGLRTEARVLQFSTATFDASIFEVFCTLCNGAALHIPPADAPLLPDSALNRFLRERRITHTLLTPAVLGALPNDDLPDLQFVVSAGDTCTAEFVNRWKPGRRAANTYGPTETTVAATVYECLPGDARPPIGKPLANTRIHILDEHGREVPIGAAGEIVIAGMGVGLGYLNRPELNEKSFVELPGFGRVYRTGDIGRWRSDGQVEHLGRKDRQVKIRGCLVAPAEVESALRTHPEVRDAVVVPQGEAPMQWLAAYTVPAVRPESLRHHLAGRVPAFMIPARFVGLEQLPLSPHGKVDIAALPPPVNGDETLIRSAPRDSVDQELQRIWGRVLGVNEPGIDDDFFALGGDSLKAAILGNEIERELKVTLPMAMLIGQPTIRNVADALRRAAQGKAVEWPVLLPIRPSGTQTPFFCLPGANASGFYLHALAQDLPADQPFYALQIPGVEPGGIPIETIEELAAFEIKHVRAVRPHGPYRLGGHSNGGIVAFEMARQLEAAGETVERVVIFDTTLADPRDRDPLEFFSEVADVGSLLDVFGWDRNLAKTLPLDENGRLSDEPAVVEFIRKLLTDNGMIPYNASPDQIARIVAVWRAAATAQANYRPASPIAAPITLFLARTVPENVIRGDERLSGWGWEKWTRAPLDVEEVPGNHVNMLIPPFSREVGRKLAEVFAPGNVRTNGEYVCAKEQTLQSSMRP